jgi:hypothetical protein
MKCLGFYRELDAVGPNRIYGEFILAVSGRGSIDSIDSVTKYLKSGYPVLDVMESTPDPLRPGHYVRGGASILTDGHWVWRFDLAYYVREHAVKLPEEFLTALVSANYVRPALELDELRRITIEVCDWLGY